MMEGGWSQLDREVVTEKRVFERRQVKIVKYRWRTEG